MFDAARSGATRVASGVFDAARSSGSACDAGRVASGVFDPARIPSAEGVQFLSRTVRVRASPPYNLTFPASEDRVVSS